MSIKSTLSEDKHQVTITVVGRFDFSTHQSFRDAYRNIDPQKVRIVIDLTQTAYIDSSALGMLLLLRERAGGEQARIIIRGCSPEIVRIFDVARFQNFFVLERETL